MQTIERSSRPPSLAGHRARTAAELAALLADLAGGLPAVVSDLSVGAWRGRAVASDLCTQLGLSAELPSPSHAFRSNGQPPGGHASQVAAGIDAETRGDSVALNALELASRIAGALAARPRPVVVIAPRWRLPWGRDNALLIRYLAEGLTGGSSVVIVATGDDPAPPAEWRVEWAGSAERAAGEPDGNGLVGLVPGILPSVLAFRLLARAPGGAVPAVRLTDDLFVVAPEARREPRTAPPEDFDQLATAARDVPWLRAYAQRFGTPSRTDPAVLLPEAFRCFADDGHDVALELIDRTVDCATSPLERALAAAPAQGLRIAMQRFDEAASVDDPPAAVPSWLEAFLLESKGWGLTMKGHVDEAESCLSRARSLTAADGDSPERLYLLNISALNRLKAGDLPGALAMEREIEAALAAEPDRDPHLTYINSINLARLYRRMGDPAAALRCYDTAFSTTLGTSSDSDAVYRHFCRARVLGELGDAEESFREWLRATLHWLASDAPEALTPRAVRGIAGGLPGYDGRVDAVSGALGAGLEDAAAAAGVAAAGQPPSTAPVFARCGSTRVTRACEAGAWGIGVHGVGVLVGEDSCPVAYRSPGFDRLARRAWALMARAAAQPVGAVLTDDRLGIGIPQTGAELLETCLRVGARGLTFGGRRLDLDGEPRAAYTNRLRVSLGPAVRDLDAGGRVRFRRSLPPRTLAAPEKRLVAALRDSPSVADVCSRLSDLSRDRVISELRALEGDRVLRLELPGDVRL